MKILFPLLYLLLLSAHGATIINPALPEVTQTPIWGFLTSAQLAVGDVVICRDEVTEAVPWFTARILAVDEDHSIMVMKPVGNGISLMTQVSLNQVLDVARVSR